MGGFSSLEVKAMAPTFQAVPSPGDRKTGTKVCARLKTSLLKPSVPCCIITAEETGISSVGDNSFFQEPAFPED